MRLCATNLEVMFCFGLFCKCGKERVGVEGLKCMSCVQKWAILSVVIVISESSSLRHEFLLLSCSKCLPCFLNMWGSRLYDGGLVEDTMTVFQRSKLIEAGGLMRSEEVECVWMVKLVRTWNKEEKREQ